MPEPADRDEAADDGVGPPGPPDPADPTTRRRTLNRDDLLDAVADHVAATGLHRFTLRQAAAAAGVTHKVLLYHFGSSDALVVEALDLIRRRTTEAGRVVIEAVPDPDLHILLDGLWATWARAGVPAVLSEALGLAIAEPTRFGDAGVRSTNDYRHVLAAGFGEYLDHLTVDPQVFATLLLAVLRGLSIDRDVTGDHARVDAAFASFRDGMLPVATGTAGD